MRFDWIIGLAIIIVLALFSIFMFRKFFGSRLIKNPKKGLFRNGVDYGKLNELQKGMVRQSIYSLVGQVAVCLFLAIISLVLLKTLALFFLCLIGMIIVFIIAWNFFRKRDWEGMFQYSRIINYGG